MRCRSNSSLWLARAAWVSLLAPLFIAPAIAPATVAEQRARLPPPAECADPIEGTWRGLSWYPLQRQWYEFTLEIRRREGSDRELTGTIVAHFWDGTPERSEPGACADGQRVRIRQPAAGIFAGGQVDFGGTAWEVESVVCGSWHGTAYVFDHFKGTLDAERQEFQSINDWTDREDDEVTVFRRIRCPDQAAPDDRALSGGAVRPPPFYPRSRSGGC